MNIPRQADWEADLMAGVDTSELAPGGILNQPCYLAGGPGPGPGGGAPLAPPAAPAAPAVPAAPRPARRQQGILTERGRNMGRGALIGAAIALAAAGVLGWTCLDRSLAALESQMEEIRRRTPPTAPTTP